MAKITKRTVDALKPRAKPYVTFDDDVKGFGLRVMPSGVKSYILEYRPGSGGRGVAKRRLTLGKHGAMTAEQARRAAQEALARIRLGRQDPQAEKSRQRASLTVGGLIDAFLTDHAGTKLKAKTADHYAGLLAKLVSAHGNMKAEALTRANVAVLHLSMAGTPFTANRFLAAVSKCFSWGAQRGLLPYDHVNPVGRIERYREHRRERFLTSDELARLGDALREGETIGLPYEVDESKPNAKHAPKTENRRIKLDPFATAAIRLLILTGRGCGRYWMPNGSTSISSAVFSFCRTPRRAGSRYI
jgi:hypothetical protein